jgi:phosphatidylserine/phosphatidylglycerophosphate/cardiolipin synthase-like enzyme/uncharacterized membrane protein YdjX (TVP38/TMEM64 family)
MVRILKQGYNCWRIVNTRKITFLIDGAAYFEALADALEQAQKNIFIAAWDIDSRTRLLRGNGPEDKHKELGNFLNTKVKQTPGLQVYVLTWDFPMLYFREREWMPVFNLGWKTHRRIHFHMDDEHPFGASQHQKFVVIDDTLAFCGGFDLSHNRWDTPQHSPKDFRRTNPDGKHYNPFHDIQMLVSGEAAEMLSELFKNRWAFATGRPIDTSQPLSVNPWPKKISPDLQDTPVAIARSFPPYKNRSAKREIANLYKDAIATAKKSIYIENQYLTSDEIAEALAKRLSEKRGPEIVIILPKESSGWLEQSTMDVLRNRVLKRLYRSDLQNRLRVFYPIAEDGETSIYIHSKIMIVDDRLVIIGSANLSNRSMGFDSECNLAIETESTHKITSAIETLRNRLLAEHIDVSKEVLATRLAEKISLIETIESLSTSRRRLSLLDRHPSLPLDTASIVQKRRWLDPEKPVAFDRMMDLFVKDLSGPRNMGAVIKITAFLPILIALAFAWCRIPLFKWTNYDTLGAWAFEFRDDPVLLAGLLMSYLVGGTIGIPLGLLTGLTAMLYSPIQAFFYALSGYMFNASITYLIGFIGLKKKTIRRLAGKKLNRLSRQMVERRDLLTIAMLRNLPAVTFSMIGILSGAFHMRIKDYMVGTLLGVFPELISITIFTKYLLQAIEYPAGIPIIIVSIFAILLILGEWWVIKRIFSNKH